MYIQKQSYKEAKMTHEQISARQSMGSNIAPMMKQPTFNWDTQDKYNKLKNFRLEIYNVLNHMIYQI